MIHIDKRVIALIGLPLSGKTTLGKEIERQTDVVFLDVDKTRQEIAPGNEWLGPDREREIMLTAYERNHADALAVLKNGKAAVLAATYSRPVYHDMLTKLTLEAGVPITVFQLQVPDQIVADRLEKRKLEDSNSNITSMESYSEVKGRYQPPTENVTIIDASMPLNNIVEFVLKELQDR